MLENHISTHYSGDELHDTAISLAASDTAREFHSSFVRPYTRGQSEKHMKLEAGNVFCNCEVLCELFNSVYDYLPPYEFTNYVISQCQMRWGVCQDIRAAAKLCNDHELIDDSNSKSGYAINITKFQEYPNKPCGSYVKCAENTKE